MAALMIATGEGWTLYRGDCPAALKELADNSVDSVVTDPPYELAFMGKAWDRQGVAYNVDLWREVLRVLKPGGHLLAFGGTRTYHRMTVAIEDAGFEIRDCIQWLYGSGFPKSHNISKAIDKAAGAERESIAPLVAPAGNKGRTVALGGSWQENPMLTAPATPEAQRWEGFGTSLKPSHEPIVLARKPLAEPTIAAQVLATGTGALNVDACRVTGVKPLRVNSEGSERLFGLGSRLAVGETTQGRWPSNLVLSHSGGCVKVGRKRVETGTAVRHNSGGNTFGGDNPKPPMGDMTYADADGMEEVDEWRCAPGCAVAALDSQAGERKTGGTNAKRTNTSAWFGDTRNDPNGGYGDTGSASRFFPVFAYEEDDFVPFRYVSKASRREREAGLEGMPPSFMVAMNDGIGARPHNPEQPTAWVKNAHPTVKPLTLMSWLCRLVTPPGGVVLDPFTGSGSTGCAALREGFGFIGVEREAEYIEIARRRLDYTLSQRPAVTQARLAV